MGSTLLGSNVSLTKKGSHLDASMDANRMPRIKSVRELGNVLTDAVAEKS